MGILKMKLFAVSLLACLICQSVLANKCSKKIIFKIEAFTGFKAFTWQTNVFGIKIVATNKSKHKLQHVAQVLAELIDNDNNGCPDDAKAFNLLVTGIRMSAGGALKKPVFLISDTVDGPKKHLGN